jgi:hypothetical protein
MLKEKFRLVGGIEESREAEREALKNLLEYSLSCALENEFSDTQFHLRAAIRSLECEHS